MKYTLEHSKRPTDIGEHLPRLYKAVVDLKAKLVIELGVRGGESTVALLEGVHDTLGELVSVDRDRCSEARKMIEGYGLSKRWTFVQSDDIEFGKSWKRPVDLVFVDTSHQYLHTKNEIEVFEPLVRAGGIMAFHDTCSFQAGVLRPIEEFLKTRPKYSFVNHINCNGFGILQKPIIL